MFIFKIFCLFIIKELCLCVRPSVGHNKLNKLHSNTDLPPPPAFTCSSQYSPTLKIQFKFEVYLCSSYKQWPKGLHHFTTNHLQHPIMSSERSAIATCPEADSTYKRKAIGLLQRSICHDSLVAVTALVTNPLNYRDKSHTVLQTGSVCAGVCVCVCICLCGFCVYGCCVCVSMCVYVYGCCMCTVCAHG